MRMRARGTETEVERKRRESEKHNFNSNLTRKLNRKFLPKNYLLSFMLVLYLLASSFPYYRLRRLPTKIEHKVREGWNEWNIQLNICNQNFAVSFSNFLHLVDFMCLIQKILHLSKIVSWWNINDVFGWKWEWGRRGRNEWNIKRNFSEKILPRNSFHSGE